MPATLDDDDVMASLPRPTCLEDLGFLDGDGSNKMIPAARRRSIPPRALPVRPEGIHLAVLL